MPLFVGYPAVIGIDKEESFTSDFFTTVVEMHGVELQFSRMGTHNSMGVGERYHALLRRVLRLDRERYPSLNPELTLRYVVKSLNGSIGPEGIIPFMDVFATAPTVPADRSKDREQEM